ncbi:MAG TPA: hypothetical protein VFN46_06150, partial [Acetobacteraceae bacterium]|nr:hypothetical protein [Acetobacteraceae bacterium]
MQVLSSDAVPAAPVEESSFIGVSNRIIAFVGDDDSSNALRLGLLGLGPDLDIRRGTIRQAIRFFEKESAHAAIVDVSGTADAPQLLEALARLCPPDLKMLVVGDNTEIGFYRLLVNEL